MRVEQFVRSAVRIKRTATTIALAGARWCEASAWSLGAAEFLDPGWIDSPRLAIIADHGARSTPDRNSGSGRQSHAHCRRRDLIVSGGQGGDLFRRLARRPPMQFARRRGAIGHPSSLFGSYRRIICRLLAATAFADCS